MSWSGLHAPLRRIFARLPDLPPRRITIACTHRRAYAARMETRHLTTEIDRDGTVRIEVPTHLHPGPAEVVVVISPGAPSLKRVSWRTAYGLGKEMWDGIDAQEYVNRLRDEWET